MVTYIRSHLVNDPPPADLRLPTPATLVAKAEDKLNALKEGRKRLRAGIAESERTLAELGPAVAEVETRMALARTRLGESLAALDAARADSPTHGGYQTDADSERWSRHMARLRPLEVAVADARTELAQADDALVFKRAPFVDAEESRYRLTGHLRAVEEQIATWENAVNAAKAKAPGGVERLMAWFAHDPRES